MGKVLSKPENSSDTPEERSEKSEELQDLQHGLSPNAQPNTTVPTTVPLQSALKKNKAWFMVRDSVETKEVRFNLADLEMREDEDTLSPPAPGYGVKFLETPVWPGRDVADQAELADDDAPVLPPVDAANTPVAASCAPDAASTSESNDAPVLPDAAANSAPDAASTSESKD